MLPDVDVDAIAPKLFAACFHNSGQTCACLKRLYVHESLYDAVCNALAERAQQAVLGDGLDAATELGPVQNAAQLAKVEAFAEAGLARRRPFPLRRSAPPGPGYFYEPTVVAGLTDGSRLVDEEPFGPIVPVIAYRDLDEVIARANANRRASAARCGRRTCGGRRQSRCASNAARCG